MCDSCGRTVRRDKAVFFEKVIFSNPLERQQVYSESYTPRLTREVAYCPSCGKHLRIYEKKRQQNERNRQRGFERRDRPPFNRGPRPGGYRPAGTSQQPQTPAQPPQGQPSPATNAQPTEVAGDAPTQGQNANL